MGGRICSLTAALLFLAACGDDGPGDNNNACPQGFEQRDGNCVPIFDDCSGPAEIPVLGGGCQPVGVTECATGFLSDGEGGCDPVLPADPCPAGTMEIIGETECQPVGVTQCAQGFVSDGEGGCDAVLPNQPCASGTMEVLGYTNCQPIGDCGTGTWGNITTDATTVFVDSSADATGANGSDASPFVTIEDALAMVQPGGQIAIAEGEYLERLQINQPVELAGRCAELVTIRGTLHMGQDRPPVTINPGGSGTALRGVTLTGDAEGLLVSGAQMVTLEQVQVVDTGDIGIRLDNGAAAVVRQSVVARGTMNGVYSRGSTLDLVQSVVRDTNTLTDGTWGRGILAVCEDSNNCGSLGVTSSLISGNRDMGVIVGGVQTTVTNSVVRETSAAQSNFSSGMGIVMQCHSDGVTCGSLSVTGSVVEDNVEVGVYVVGSDAVIADTVVRDTSSRQSTGLRGWGIGAECDEDTGVAGNVQVTGSVVAGNHDKGLFILGPDITVAGTIVRDTNAQLGDGRFGRGIEAQCHPMFDTCGSLSVTDSVFLRNRDMGIFTAGVVATVTRTVVRDTAAQQSDGMHGRGINAQCHPTVETCGRLEVSNSLVASNQELGIFVHGVETLLTASVARDTLPQESTLEDGRGIEASCHFDLEICSTLTVTGCLVEGNRDVGIAVIGSDATIERTVVRDTQGRQSDGMRGWGVGVICDWVHTGTCGALAVDQSLIAGNRDVGLIAFGTDSAITRTVVRDTASQQSDGDGGWGIGAQCDRALGICGGMNINQTLVRGNRGTAVFLSGVPSVVTGAMVRDTRAVEGGHYQDRFGHGIYALCDTEIWRCAAIGISGSVIADSTTVGLSVKGTTGFIEASLIDSVSFEPLDSAYGYGIQVEGLPDFQPVVFDVRSCLIRDSTLAAILYHRARGIIDSTTTSGGQYAVVANIGSEPEIGDENDLSGTTQGGLHWSNMDPAPAPAPLIPMDPN